MGRYKLSAGALVWRRVGDEIEVLIVHPGGPWFANKDAGAWSIPKGECEAAQIDQQALEDTAVRELFEETGLRPETPLEPLGSIKQRGGKVVHAFAVEADSDLPRGHRPPQVRIEWPPRSGRELAFEEVDEVRFVPIAVARDKLNPAQVAFLDRLLTRC